MLKIERLSGDALAPFIDDIARLRIQVFRDFPYLYDGDMDYERRYLQTVLDSAQAAVVLVRDGAQVVGASTCLPLRDEENSFKAPLGELGFEPNKVFYLAESVLEKNYRGQGFGVRFFNDRESYAQELGGFEYTCFCAVKRPPDHPQRPIDYTPLDAFWRKRGYAPCDAHAEYAWLDVGDEAESQKQLQFWIKAL